MSNILALTKLYFLGCLRRQAHLSTLFLGAILLMLPAYVNAFSLGISAFERVSKDFGLTLITYFGVGMTLLLASSSIPKDLENRSIYPILARPINRLEYILGHLMAILLLIALSLLILGSCLTVSVAGLSRTVDFQIFIALLALFGQLSIVASLTVAVSTVASPALAGTVGAFVYLIGSLPGAFIRFFLLEDRGSEFSSMLATALKAVLPNLSIFQLKDAVVHNIEYSSAYLPSICLYAMLWVLIALTLSAMLFGRKDL